MTCASDAGRILSVKIHYRSDIPGAQAVNRVAVYCGAITHWSNPQTFIVETPFIKDVTCKNCARRLNGELSLL